MATTTTARRRTSLRRITAGAVAVSLGTALVAVSTAAASPTPEQTRATPAAVARDLDAVIAAGSANGVALVRSGDAAVRLARGVADPTTGRPAALSDEYRVGSVTKSFTAVLVMQLVAARRVALDAPAALYLPAGTLPADKTGITVRQLLQHTSGLADYVSDPAVIEAVAGDPTRDWSPLELARPSLDAPLQFQPGTEWSYSNTGYVLLGELLERETGRTFAQLVDERIAAPLRLRHTYVPTSSAWRGQHAHGFLTLDPEPTLDVTDWSPTWAGAAGALVSTADDLSRFYRALFGGRLLPQPIVRQMTTPRWTGAQGPFARIGYGLGITVLDSRCGTFWGHNGAIPGYMSNAFYSARTKGTAVAIVGADESDGAVVAAFDDLAKSTLCLAARS